MSRKLLLIFFILIILGIIIYLLLPFFKTTQQLRPQADGAVSVTVAPAKQTTLSNHIEAVGTAKADEAVTITATVTEHVKKINFASGDFVKKGTLLVELDNAEEQARLREAEAKLTEAKKQFDRFKHLSARNFAARSEYDTKIYNLNAAKAKIIEIQATINDRFIRAPFSGILGHRNISEGTLVKPGDAIVTLDKVDPIKVDFSIPEKYAGSIKKNETIHAKSIAYPKKTFTGKISNIAARIDIATRSLMLRAIINNPDYILRPGMLLQIDIKRRPRQALLIPEQALVPRNDQQYVFILQKNNTVKLQAVQIGERLHGKVEIISGLTKGMQVVVDGGFKLHQGKKVKVIKSNLIK